MNYIKQYRESVGLVKDNEKNTLLPSEIAKSHLSNSKINKSA